MTTLAFPGQVPFTDPSVPAGGCELGQGRCTHEPEVEVLLPAIGSKRLLCREHVGYYMLAATSAGRFSVVEVRRVSRPFRSVS
jgi:hypothetical protein